MAENHFHSVVETLQQTQKALRPEALIRGIAKEMAQSSNQQTQQLGQELSKIESQLVSAFQQ